MKKNFDVLIRAQGCYQALSRFRTERERNKRYNYGDQWGDTIDVDGQLMTEEQYIRSQGSEPLKNNLIRRLVRNVIGVYRAQAAEPKCTPRNTAEGECAEIVNELLRHNADINRLSAVNARSLEDFLIGGLIAQRKWYGERNGRLDCWTDYVPPRNFFVDSGMRDFHSWDCACIGEVHDISFADLCRNFSQCEADCTALAKIYGMAADRSAVAECWGNFGFDYSPSFSFLLPSQPGRCRVIEAWVKECLPCTEDGTWRLEEKWRFYFLTPFGDVLAEGDTPYAHGSHPYVMKAYPMIDGEIHAFVSDVIDQQRYTNRLITLYDWMARASAKGVLLVPEDCLPRGGNLRDFAATWSKLNGVLAYRPSNSGEAPRQVNGNVSNMGISELLNMQLKFFEDISGVHGALEGRLDNSGMSAELYGQQTQNATTALLDVLSAFSEFLRDAAYKDVSNMLQYYTRSDMERIAGRSVDLHNAAFDLSIASPTTAASQSKSTNELLIEIWKSGQITLEQMLSAGNFPFAESLMKSRAKETPGNDTLSAH